MTILGLIFAALGVLTALGNAGGLIQATVRTARGKPETYSAVHFVSLLFCGLAWIATRDRFLPWILLPIVLDPANWLLAAMPFVLLYDKLKGGGPSRSKTAPSGQRQAAGSIPEDIVELQLTPDEALVLFGFVTRFTNDGVLTIDHGGERAALWSLSAALERSFTQPLQPNYQELLNTARLRLELSASGQMLTRHPREPLEQARRLLIDELERWATLHESRRYTELGSAFDEIEAKLNAASMKKRAGSTEDKAYRLLDAWLDAWQHDWLHYEPVREDDWPRLARRMKAILEGFQEYRAEEFRGVLE